ncbi:SpoIIE family protein phosphatase [Streptomyces sp. TS71-3]|uniref:SpoIIE family protein phosphatase n=1 Tax=Streptomyces sp. TS71-3 TaxID=2733862 RepID=UPI001B208009|nr:SpoIIE family protein phosphatase [Streptomyces sp. TS71-3]GHJ42359.1 magnesium or manganese-dependent protein phosphatase [Streptomyces sp. TS71-3]
MAVRGARSSPEEPESEHQVPILALNRLGSFHWDLDGRRLDMDATGLAVFGLDEDDYDQRPSTLGERIPRTDARRIRDTVTTALRSGAQTYGTYFRVSRPGEGPHWAHTHGFVRRDARGRARWVHGIVRDATDELGEPGSAAGGPRRSGERPMGDIVQEATVALGRARTVDEVIQVLQDAYDVERLGSASMALGLVDNGRVRIVAAQPPRRLIPGTEVTRLEEPYPTNDAVRTLAPVFIESPEQFKRAYPDLWESFGAHGMTAAAYLPLVAQGRPIGVFGLHYHGKYEFSHEERNLLLALASNIAQGLQRAMFFDQAQDLAQSLQEAMLPHSIPQVPGADVAVRYRSASLAREIGGDWYDIIPLPQGRYGAVIGDVQGHDMHAAAVMGQLRIVLRAYACEGHTPATVMARASVFLHELDTDRFATCVYADADLSTGVIRLVRAGHLGPLLREADGTCRPVDVAGGLPLGHSQEFGRPEYEVTTLVLAPGQSLLLFTDGLVERPGADVEQGLAELAEQVATGTGDVERLADQLASVADEREGEDDVALLLLRRHGRAGDRPGRRLRCEVLRNDPEALVATRRMIRDAGRGMGIEERGDEVELVADELITNVLVHTGSAATVTVRAPEDRTDGKPRMRVEVEDASSTLPRRRETGESGVSGRGLLLVDELSDGWGVESRGEGKCVWSEFTVPED